MTTSGASTEALAARPKVLLVDDDEHLLAALRRQLHRRWDVTVASSGGEGLGLLEREGPFDVVVSDYRMPRMAGDEFLAKARAVAPETVRVLLTGQADLAGAASVVNEGAVFRFLLKPVASEALEAALVASAEQARLLRAERELLEQTLRGSVKALSDVLALASPATFARAARMQHLATLLFGQLGSPVPWDVELAVILSQLGAVALPDEVLERFEGPAQLAPEEQAMVDGLPALAVQLLSAIPRLEPVLSAIERQHERLPEHPPLGSRVLRIVADYDVLERRGADAATAMRALRHRSDVYDAVLLDALAIALEWERSADPVVVDVDDLRLGMVLAADLCSEQGLKLVAAGTPITAGLLARLRNLDSRGEEPLGSALVHPRSMGGSLG